MPKLPAIVAAVNAYPWTRGWVTRRVHGVPHFCALGALLRYAGLTEREIRRAERKPVHTFWEERGALLEAEYGITNVAVVHRIMTLNDTAASQEDAAARLVWRFSNTTPMEEILTPRQLRRHTREAVWLQLQALGRATGVQPEEPITLRHLRRRRDADDYGPHLRRPKHRPAAPARVPPEQPPSAAGSAPVGFVDKDAFLAAFAPGGPGGEYFLAGRENAIRELAYAAHLRAMGEPPFRPPPGDAPPGPERYRFLWLRSFDAPVAVRAERVADGAWLRAVELDRRGGNEPGALARGDTRPMPPAAWDEFMRLLAAADYWALPTDDPWDGLDGAMWVLEGVRQGRYHLVDRWSPWPDRHPAFAAACLYLLRLSALAPTDADRVY